MTLGRTTLRPSRTLSLASALLTLTLATGLAATTVGCGAEAQGAKTASVQPGDLPDGAQWTGVYYSELYGYLHLVQDGTSVSGKWMRPVKDRWGELHGTAVGDLIRFEWTEHIVGRVGPNASLNGKGYLKYSRPPGDNVDDSVIGEIGRGADEVGEPWDAIKQRNMMPDLASIGGSGTTDLGGGDWDDGNTESGTPEEPAPPPL